MSNLTEFIPASPLPYGCQTLDEVDIQAVIEVLKSPYITQGPAIEYFEQAVAAYCNVPYAVAFANGTAALHGACYAAGIGQGDEVITTPLTFVASANAVLYQQGTPVFADIQPGTLNLDPAQVAQRIASRTKALIPVHFAGQPVDLDSLYALADKHQLTVIEDACHALGARHHENPIGQCRDMAVFSFHPVKSITTGEGGMVVTPHRKFYDKLRQFRSHGIVKNPDDFQMMEAAPWMYEMQHLGYNYRLTDIQAALGVSQMSRLDSFIAARNHLAARYRKAFDGYAPIVLQESDTTNRSADHLFLIQLNPAATSVTRRDLFEKLVEANIRPQVHYLPVHLQPYYRSNFGTRPGDFPKAEAYYEHCLSLPLYPRLTEDAQDYVIHQVKTILGHP